MSEEEKEAIESLKKLVQLRKNKRGEIKHDTCIYSTKDLEIILNLIQKQQKAIEKKDKIIDEIHKEIREHIGFENRLKRDNRKPDMFNEGRFYVANNINNILKGK